ncbi:hypothetical protein OSJ06_25185, partial [Mycobacterium ulcerans]
RRQRRQCRCTGGNGGNIGVVANGTFTQTLFGDGGNGGNGGNGGTGGTPGTGGSGGILIGADGTNGS